MRIILPLLAFGGIAALVASCSDPANPTSSASSSTNSGSGTGGTGASSTTSSSGQGGAPDAAINGPCKLPGSLQFFHGRTFEVPGGKSGHDLSYLTLPSGFCAHWFGNVGNTRQLRFAPGGELFVASPTTSTTGGGPGGKSAIMVLPDDDHDGYADNKITFLSALPSTQGLLFANDHFYFQDDTKIRRIPYAAGDRHPSGSSEVVADISIHVSQLHWPKALDIADDGTIYVGNGGDQGDTCEHNHPFLGGILKIGGSNPIGGTVVTKGFRNPIAIRCAKGHNRCFALELAKDFSSGEHGREKVVPIRSGDDWGFPCCATKDEPYDGVGPNPNCDVVTPDKTSFFIGDTPFGLAFQSSSAPWAGAWKNKAFIALHGAAGSWIGARVVGVDIDPDTGLLLAGTNIHNHTDQGAITAFADGWDDGTLGNGRPSSVEFSDDGRLFLGNDGNGDIIWIAPLDL